MKYIIGAILALVISMPVRACDVCGCGSGGGMFGVLPQSQKHFVGMRYQFRYFDSRHVALFPGDPEMKTRETYHIAEIWGRWVPHERVQVFAFLPMQWSSQQTDSARYNLLGIGDMSIQVHYVALKKTDSTGRHGHLLQLGAGIKLPTGRHDLVAQEGVVLPALQPGTGSVDIPFSLIYQAKFNKHGLALESSFRLNTTNIKGYKFGNKATAIARYMYWIPRGFWTILPSAGAWFEYAAMDRDNGVRTDYTGGMALSAGGGIDVYFKSFAFQLHVSQPVWQNMGEGQISARTRIQTGLIYSF